MHSAGRRYSSRSGCQFISWIVSRANATCFLCCECRRVVGTVFTCQWLDVNWAKSFDEIPFIFLACAKMSCGRRRMCVRAFSRVSSMVCCRFIRAHFMRAHNSTGLPYKAVERPNNVRNGTLIRQRCGVTHSQTMRCGVNSQEASTCAKLCGKAIAVCFIRFYSCLLRLVGELLAVWNSEYARVYLSNKNNDSRLLGEKCRSEFQLFANQLWFKRIPIDGEILCSMYTFHAFSCFRHTQWMAAFY